MKPVLSRRGNELLKNAEGGIFDLFKKILGNMYSKDNPDGVLSLGVAENSLMHEWLTKYYNDSFKLSYEDFTYGDSPNGSKRLFNGLCKLYNSRYHPVTEVKPEHLFSGVGASAVVDQLTSLLCNEGEGIMIAEPYYNGFDVDLATRNGAVPIGVPLPKVSLVQRRFYSELGVDPGSPETLDAFEESFAAHSKKGPKPRAVILCNPQNPLGFCYPKETILAYLRFCQRHNLHLISDEIYALSTYGNGGPDERPFISVLSIDVQKEAGCDPSRVHAVTGMSKDFCANGFRIGVCISQHNADLAKAWLGPLILMKVASPAELMWAHLLHDQEALEHFLAENKRRLAASYASTVAWLKKHDIPFRPAYAGHFIWIDLRKELPTHDKDGKKLDKAADQAQALFTQFIDESKVYAAPALIYHGEPGFFRITMAMRSDYLNIGLDRLAKTLEANRDRRQQLNGRLSSSAPADDDDDDEEEEEGAPARAVTGGQATDEAVVRRDLAKLATA